VVIGLIASAALLLMNGENFGTETTEIIISVIIALAALATVLFTKIHPILVIIASGIAGFIIYY
jgi:chromate transporter